MEFEIETKLSSEMDKENQKKLKIIFTALFILGCIGIVAYILLGVVFFPDEEPRWLEGLLGFSAILFALGLVVPIALNCITKKNAPSLNGIVNRYYFFEEYVNVFSYRGEEKIGEAKNYYKEFTRFRKTERYVYLYLGMKGAYVMEKASLTDEQIEWISQKVKKKNAA